MTQELGLTGAEPRKLSKTFSGLFGKLEFEDVETASELTNGEEESGDDQLDVSLTSLGLDFVV